ncbi:MAG: hypothetical protein ACLFSZ_09825 [Puniceicoccaceae bacterium]
MTAPVEDGIRLVVAAESGRIDAGVVRDGAWIARAGEAGNAVEALAAVLGRALGAAGVRPGGLSAWIYSGGPGSLLGLRSLAMTLETWDALGGAAGGVLRLRFSGMVWTARHLMAARGPGAFVLASPWRKGAWNVLRVGERPPDEGDLTVVEGEPAAGGLPGFCLGDRPGVARPAGFTPVDLPPFAGLAAFLDSPGFLRATGRVEPIETGTTTYREWVPSAR